jgi:Flp pilus assembly pilin Flp
MTFRAALEGTDMFQRIVSRVRREFASRDSGQDLLEYALLVALIVIVVMSAVTPVGTTIKTVFWDVISASANAI